MTVWRRCNKCRSESDIAQNIDRCPACKAAWVGREFERAGDEGHDETREPCDSTVAAMQEEFAYQIKAETPLPTETFESWHGSSKYHLRQAVIHLRMYEQKLERERLPRTKLREALEKLRK